MMHDDIINKYYEELKQMVEIIKSHIERDENYSFECTFNSKHTIGDVFNILDNFDKVLGDLVEGTKFKISSGSYLIKNVGKSSDKVLRVKYNIFKFVPIKDNELGD